MDDLGSCDGRRKGMRGYPWAVALISALLWTGSEAALAITVEGPAGIGKEAGLTPPTVPVTVPPAPVKVPAPTLPVGASKTPPPTQAPPAVSIPSPPPTNLTETTGSDPARPLSSAGSVALDDPAAASQIGSIIRSTATAAGRAIPSRDLEVQRGSAGPRVDGAARGASNPASGAVEPSSIAPFRSWVVYVWPAVALGDPSLTLLLSRWEGATMRMLRAHGLPSLGIETAGSAAAASPSAGNPPPPPSPTGLPATLKNWLGSEPPLPQAVFYIVLVAGAALIWVLVRKELGGAQMMRRR